MVNSTPKLFDISMDAYENRKLKTSGTQKKTII